ncbi:protein phosphatase [Fusobacterium naviforme]|nr:protein phosphatase [Fusobacterium naviforme]
MDEMNVSEALVKAILEILEKCKTLEEAKESIGNLLK